MQNQSAIEENKLADAEDWLRALDRKVVDADIVICKDYDIDLESAALHYVRNYEGTNKFMLSLKSKDQKGYKLTQPQLRAALNVKVETGSILPHTDESINCFVCKATFESFDDLHDHTEAEHEGPARIPVLTESPDVHGKMEGVAVIENTTATLGLDLTNLPDARYAVPNLSKVMKDDFVFITVKRVRHTVARDRRYVYGKVVSGSEVVLQGTIEVRIWSSDSKELVGEQKPGDVYRGKLEEELQMVMTNPESFGKLFGMLNQRCCICGKELTDDISRSIGMGLECEKKTQYFSTVPDSYIPTCPTCHDDGVERRGTLTRFLYGDKSAAYKCILGHNWTINKKGEVVHTS